MHTLPHPQFQMNFAAMAEKESQDFIITQCASVAETYPAEKNLS